MSRSGISVAERCDGPNYKPVTCADIVSEGGLEPFAYILSGSPESWLTV
jgi:hypothetical protein